MYVHHIPPLYNSICTICMHLPRTLNHALLTWKQQARPTHSYLPFPFETGVAVALVLAQEEAVGSEREFSMVVHNNYVIIYALYTYSFDVHTEMLLQDATSY